MNRFQIALQVLEKVYPTKEKVLQTSQPNTEYQHEQTHDHRLGRQSLSQYIQSIQPLPYYSVLLGVCEDGLPLLLDLNYDATGPVFITGSHSASIQNYIALLLNSISLINPPEYVQVYLITPNAFPFENEIQMANCVGSYHPQERSAGELIMDLSALVEQRNSGRQRGAAIMLVIQDLDEFIRTLDEDVYSHFLWLLREGPFAKVWPLVSLHSSSRLFTDFKFESLFETKILVSNSFSHSESPLTGAEVNPQPYRHHQVVLGAQRVNFTLPVSP